MFKKIKKEDSHKLTAPETGFYQVILEAGAAAGPKLNLRGRHDLKVALDGRQLREIPARKNAQYYNIPPAWNGTHLKGISKIVILLTKLTKGDHWLKFIANETAILEKEPELKKIAKPNQAFKVIENLKTEERNRQPWITIALLDLPLNFMDVSVTCEKRRLDSDDVKLIIDGEIQKNEKAKIWGRNWFWQGRQLKGQTETKRFYLNLPQEIHYLEFWADRTPVLDEVKLVLGEIEKPGDDVQEKVEPEASKKESEPKKNPTEKRIPTVDDPKWTGDFEDDTEQMLLARVLFGEARNEGLSDKARIAVGWTVKNRVENPGHGENYHQVILEENQYSSFRESDDNWPFVKNPLLENSSTDQEAWINCYEIAGQILAGTVADPTQGANHYYDESIETPYWANEDNFKIKINTIFFHHL